MLLPLSTGAYAHCPGSPVGAAEKGNGMVPAANFDAAYKAAHEGQIRVSIPEVYELVHVALALTATAQKDETLTAKQSEYYRDLMNFFEPVANHPFVLSLNRELENFLFSYRDLKMNAYAFEYDRCGNIVRSETFRRTSPPETTENALLPYLEEMRDFSQKSRFREFYQKHGSLYQSQVGFYTNDLDVSKMHDWLQSRFPNVKPYNTINILLSPLVRALQSVTWFESNGFRELQPHVNFPYPTAADRELSPSASALRRGFVIFGEINHGFVDETGEKHVDRIADAVADRGKWVKSGPATSTYDTPQMVFNEMMNWGLISLYLADQAPELEREKLIEQVEQIMERRGFLRFRDFNKFLVQLYVNRPHGRTIADLYPDILDWFAAQRSKPA